MRDLLAECRTTGLEDQAPPMSLRPITSPKRYAARCGRGAQQHPAGAADTDPIMDEAMLGFVDGGVDVTDSRVEERGERSGSLDRGFDQALTSPEQARKPTV
jgi:hypothetical protein